MDDLFLAAFRRRAEVGVEHLTRALTSDEPLRALWAFGDDPTSTALNMEFVALANHRKSIRAEIARYAEDFRARQAEVLAGLMEARGIDTDRLPPVAVMTVMTSVAQILVLEESLGIEAGHAETRALVARLVGGFGRDTDGSRTE